MKRREFITFVGGAAAWPLAARAQQHAPMRRIVVLMAWSDASPFRAWIDTFLEGLAQSGWVDGRTAQIDMHWANGDPERMRTLAKQLVELQPDVIFASTTPVNAALQRETRTIPIVFVIVSDPVGAGFISSFAHPGGNTTGFINSEPAMAGKWLEILRDIVPQIRRVGIMFNPDTAPDAGKFYSDPCEAAARSMAIEPITAPVHSDAEIEAAIASLGRNQAGLVVQSDSFLAVHLGTVISAAIRKSVPAIGADHPAFARGGGLVSYGPHFPDIFRRAVSYVDRILRGVNPGDLPVQAPDKYELVINLKTAKTLGLTIPQSLLATADEVID